MSDPQDESKVLTENEDLFRQIHPNHFNGGQFSSLSFRPTQNDEGDLSVYRGPKISAARSWLYYTTVRKRQSCCVLSFSVKECTGIGRKAYASPIQDACYDVGVDTVLAAEGDGAHGHLDFRNLTEKEVLKYSKLLKAKSVARPPAYIPPLSV